MRGQPSDLQANPAAAQAAADRLLQAAGASGIVTVLYAAPALVALEVLPVEKGTPFLALRTGDLVFFLFALGFLASGGSGLWNAALTYLLKVKDIKAEVAARSRQANPPPDRK